MKLVAVEQVPGRRENNKLQKLLEEFVYSKADVVKVNIEDSEYKSVHVAYNVLAVAVRRSKRPIKVHIRGNDIYLAKIK